MIYKENSKTEKVSSEQLVEAGGDFSDSFSCNSNAESISLELCCDIQVVESEYNIKAWIHPTLH